MATLRFSFGTMGSGKSTVALQIHHNLSSRDLYGLLLTCLDREGDQVTSRLGVAAPAIDVTPDMDLHKLCVDHWPIHYLVCDEAQFYTTAQCDQLARAVDELEVEVYAFGLITDFRGRLSPAPPGCSRSPTSACRCRSKRAAGAGRGPPTTPASSTARSPTRARPSWSATRPSRGTPLFGDAVRYELLCRRHFHDGELGV